MTLNLLGPRVTYGGTANTTISARWLRGLPDQHRRCVRHGGGPVWQPGLHGVRLRGRRRVGQRSATVATGTLSTNTAGNSALLASYITSGSTGVLGLVGSDSEALNLTADPTVRLGALGGVNATYSGIFVRQRYGRHRVSLGGGGGILTFAGTFANASCTSGYAAVNLAGTAFTEVIYERARRPPWPSRWTAACCCSAATRACRTHRRQLCDGYRLLGCRGHAGRQPGALSSPGTGLLGCIARGYRSNGALSLDRRRPRAGRDARQHDGRLRHVAGGGPGRTASRSARLPTVTHTDVGNVRLGGGGGMLDLQRCDHPAPPTWPSGTTRPAAPWSSTANQQVHRHHRRYHHRRHPAIGLRRHHWHHSWPSAWSTRAAWCWISARTSPRAPRGPPPRPSTSAPSAGPAAT